MSSSRNSPVLTLPPLQTSKNKKQKGNPRKVYIIKNKKMQMAKTKSLNKKNVNTQRKKDKKE